MTPGPWTDNTICPNQHYGQHITVRCKGCNSIHSTKNIGWTNQETKVVSLARGLFDTMGCFCLCKNPSEFPLIHDCEVDDNLDFAYDAYDKGLEGHQVAGTQKAREAIQSWWVRFAESKKMEQPTQEDLDKLVPLIPKPNP